MYFNDVHILYFVGITIIGLIVGKIVAWCNIRIPQNKKIFSKEFFEEDKKGFEGNYIFMVITSIFYIAVLYKFGIQKDDISQNLDLIKFMILIPMLILTFSIDIKHRIIPNRLNLTILEFGLIITFVYGITNINLAKDYILGMVTGAIIFIIITVLGWIISGKEAMGLGDVKFMGALGLYYGMSSIAEISLLAFFIASISSIVILFIRILILKIKDEYIAFGPFLSISAIICIFLIPGTVFEVFLNICKIIGDKILI